MVERLGRHLPGVVDPHERGAVSAGLRVVIGIGDGLTRVVALGDVARDHRPQGPVELADQPVGERVDVRRGAHGLILYRVLEGCRPQ